MTDQELIDFLRQFVESKKKNFSEKASTDYNAGYSHGVVRFANEILEIIETRSFSL